MSVELLPSYREAVRTIEACLRGDGSVLVCIDGRCGSGKTTIAAALQRYFACNVIHIDDFYLPMSARNADWMDSLGGNIDFVRLREEILEPVSRGQDYFYRAYSCQKGTYGEPVLRKAEKLTILEGSYSLHPALQADPAVRIFVTCSQDVRLKRLKEREQEGYEQFLRRWIPLEERYFAAYRFPDENMQIICTDDL